MIPRNLDRELANLRPTAPENRDNFRCTQLEASSHCSFSTSCVQCFRCTYCTGCASCSGCTHCTACSASFDCTHCENSQMCVSSAYLVGCESCVRCQYCFGCVGLTAAEFCIFNEPVGRKAYFAALPELRAKYGLG